MRGAPNLLGSFSELLLGLFIMLFAMFYSLQTGRGSLERVRAVIPLAPNLKDKLIEEIESVTWAVVYGQVVTALIQGTLEDSVFSSSECQTLYCGDFVMIVLSFIPLFGTPLINIGRHFPDSLRSNGAGN